MYENLKKMSRKCKACNIPTKLDKHEMELFWLQEFSFKKTSYEEATRFGMCKRKLEDYKRKIICHVGGPRLCHGKYCCIHVGKDYMYLWLQPHYKSLNYGVVYIVARLACLSWCQIIFFVVLKGRTQKVLCFS